MNYREKNTFWLGASFILIGTVLTLANFDLIDIGRNWWALFFLIPIASIGSSIWRMRAANQGKFPAAARGQFVGLTALIVVMCVFLFGIPWRDVWPVLLILIGAAMIIGTRFE